MRIGFISPSVPGHLNPMTKLARQLQLRGHDVVYIGLPLAGPAVRAAHLPFVPCGEKEFTEDHSKELLLQLSKLNGGEARQFTIGVVGAITEAMLNSLPTILPAAGVDALVIDTYHFYVELATTRLGLPYVHVSNALHFDYSGYTPLFRTLLIETTRATFSRELPRRKNFLRQPIWWSKLSDSIKKGRLAPSSHRERLICELAKFPS
jgi:zeaxanthin glucosyltransferase